MPVNPRYLAKFSPNRAGNLTQDPEIDNCRGEHEQNDFWFAWAMDEDREQERWVTMEVGTLKFDTKKHKITVFDTPGHANFILQIIGWASSTNMGVLMVDSWAGRFKSGM